MFIGRAMIDRIDIIVANGILDAVPVADGSKDRHDLATC